MARYIENGFAKVAPCECSTASIHEKRWAGEDASSPVWYCRNCGAVQTRRIRRGRKVITTDTATYLMRDGWQSYPAGRTVYIERATGGRVAKDADGELVLLRRT